VYSDGPMSLPGDGYGMAEHSYDSVVNLLHDKGVTLNSFYYYTHYAPDIIDLAAATGGQWLNIYYEGLNDLDLITATYALWWNDADPWVDNSHFLLLSIYNSPEDKANNNPWRNIYGWFEF
jgi:hypothetical protein